MLYLLLYLVIGLVVVVLCVATECISAKTNNLDVEDYLDWYNEESSATSKTEVWLFVIAFIIGLFVWPLRVISFELERLERFNAYIAECEKEEES